MTDEYNREERYESLKTEAEDNWDSDDWYSDNWDSPSDYAGDVEATESELRDVAPGYMDGEG